MLNNKTNHVNVYETILSKNLECFEQKRFNTSRLHTSLYLRNQFSLRTIYNLTRSKLEFDVTYRSEDPLNPQQPHQHIIFLLSRLRGRNFRNWRETACCYFLFSSQRNFFPSKGISASFSLWVVLCRCLWCVCRRPPTPIVLTRDTLFYCWATCVRGDGGSKSGQFCVVRCARAGLTARLIIRSLVDFDHVRCCVNGRYVICDPVTGMIT